MSRRNLYAVLGLASNATQEQIKTAYRKLAVRWHPDKKGGDEAHFKRISEAYSILSDPKRRAEWDAARAAWLAKHFLVDCQACGEPIKLPGVEGLAVDCPKCGKKDVVPASATGKIKFLGLEFLQGSARNAEEFAKASVRVGSEELQKVAENYVTDAAQIVRRFLKNRKMRAPKPDVEE